MKAVLTFHSVDDSGSAISVTRAQLSRQLDAIAASGARVVSLDSIHQSHDDEHAIAITFDDGFSNFASEAVPELNERNLRCTVFVVPGFVGQRNAWELHDSRADVPALSLMSWDDIRSLNQEVVEVGAHGLNHRSFVGLPHNELLQELSECAAIIQKEVGKRPRSLAFPYGDFDKESVSAASKMFDVACTTEFGLVTASTDAHSVPRLDAFYFRDNDMLRRFGSIEFAAWVHVRHAARAARRLIRSRSDE